MSGDAVECEECGRPAFDSAGIFDADEEYVFCSEACRSNYEARRIDHAIERHYERLSQ